MAVAARQGSNGQQRVAAARIGASSEWLPVRQTSSACGMSLLLPLFATIAVAAGSAVVTPAVVAGRVVRLQLYSKLLGGAALFGHFVARVTAGPDEANL